MLIFIFSYLLSMSETRYLSYNDCFAIENILYMYDVSFPTDFFVYL